MFNMMKSAFVFFLVVSLLSTSAAFAEVEIGNGFKCEGASIFKGTKSIPYSKAKSNISTTLQKLKDKKETAKTKKQKDAINAKIKEANNSRTLLKACSSGQLSPDQVDPVFTQLASGNGTYGGNYSGTVDGFFPISGTITAQFTLDGTTFSTLLSLGGNLGSTLDAKPLSFSADVGGIGFPAQFFLPGTFIGDVTLSVTQSGHLTITNANTNTGAVTFDGQFSNNAISSTLGGSYKGHSFNGSANLTHQ